jgi:hypothetical protein
MINESIVQNKKPANGLFNNDIAGHTTVLGTIAATIVIIEMTSFIAAKKQGWIKEI